ncbi:unnamed protein product [Timema podura]|uniref:Uncharacterized protein n=1 Tax=Timema podura TaxID=61482 RepID=A0ABN7NN21_TIMPD|nr:unnamed protein product [Timema podura]
MWSLATLLVLPLALVTSYEDHVNILNLNAEENAVVVEAWTGFIKDSGTMKLLLDGLQLTKTHKYGMLDSKFGLEDVYVDPDVVEEVMNFGVDVVRSLEDDKTLARLFRQKVTAADNTIWRMNTQWETIYEKTSLRSHDRVSKPPDIYSTINPIQHDSDALDHVITDADIEPVSKTDLACLKYGATLNTRQHLSRPEWNGTALESY